MTTHKDKKVKSYRGSKTHGGGSMKKRRGAGNRGGKGLAGSGKRAGHKVQYIIKRFGKGYLGKNGFTSGKKIEVRRINLKDIESNLDNYMERGFAKKEGDFVSINLKDIGYDKLLGSGKVKTKFQIKVKFFSKKAKEKLEKIGGQIVAG
jgi:large subunit ribosomal protein L15